MFTCRKRLTSYFITLSAILESTNSITPWHGAWVLSEKHLNIHNVHKIYQGKTRKQHEVEPTLTKWIISEKTKCSLSGLHNVSKAFMKWLLNIWKHSISHLILFCFESLNLGKLNQNKIQLGLNEQLINYKLIVYHNFSYIACCS